MASTTLLAATPHSTRVDSQVLPPDGVSLVIPAYNEANRIGSVLPSYSSILKLSGLPYELIVVVDGSDATAEVVTNLGDPHTRTIRFAQRQGKGGALIAGFRAAQYRRVGYTDADGSLAPESLLALVEMSSKYDCVFGSRWVPGAVWMTRESRRKEVASRAFNAIVRATLGIEVRDTQCGAKFYSAAVLGRLLPKVHVNNLTTDVSFIFHADRIGASTVEVPVRWTNHLESHFDLIRMTLYMSLTVMGMRVMNSRGRALVPRSLVRALQRVVEGV
jgi:dolichol-phosphate mannosyltransferase